MRVLMIVRQYFPWIGGTERQAQKLSVKLIELDVDVHVVTGWWFLGTPRQETIETVPVYRNFTFWEMFGIKGLRKFGACTYILSLFWYLWKHRHQYDLIHIHMLSYAAFPAVLAGHWLGKKIIIKMANSGQFSDILRMKKGGMVPGQRQMLPTALRADQIVAINEEIVTELNQAGVSSERIIIIPNGVEINGAYKCDYKLDGKVNLIFVGRLAYQKGLDILLPAFKQAIHDQPDILWKLWLLGDGPMRSELEMTVQKLGIAEAVEFRGKVDDVPYYLNKADIFVLPSRSEGMSNALLEAMAHGLPCIASYINGNTDLIEHGENGLLVSPENEEELVKALIQMVNDHFLRQKVGKLARQTVQTQYSIDSVAERYLELYNKLLQTSNENAISALSVH